MKNLGDSLFLILCTGGGAGLLPAARGTAGTAVGVALYLAVRPWAWGPWIAAGAASVLCVLLGRWAERRFGGKDPSPVVLDEVAGAVATFLAVPDPGPWTLAAGFLLFRLLDIAKPFPINRLQSLPAGWGIVADDLLAAALANGLLQAAIALK